MAKVLAVQPKVLSYNLATKLKPAVAWLLDVGLSRRQVAKVISQFPAVLTYSISSNLSQKRHLLQKFFTAQDISSVIERHPPILGYSYARLAHRLKLVQDCLVLSREWRNGSL